MEERTTGSYQFIASALTEHFNYPVSRQQVYAWWRRRGVNGFPQEIAGELVHNFDLAEVREWYDLNYPEARRERLKCQNQARKSKRSATDSGESIII